MRGAVYFAQGTPLSSWDACDRAGTDYSAVPCFAVVLLVVRAGGGADRVWALVLALLLTAWEKGEGDAGDRIQDAAVSVKAAFKAAGIAGFGAE